MTGNSANPLLYDRKSANPLRESVSFGVDLENEIRQSCLMRIDDAAVVIMFETRNPPAERRVKYVVSPLRKRLTERRKQRNRWRRHGRFRAGLIQKEASSNFRQRPGCLICVVAGDAADTRRCAGRIK